MGRLFVIAAIGALAAIAAGVSLFAAVRTEPPAAVPPSSAPVVASAPTPPPPVPPRARPRRAGRALSLDDAVKQLDLIRPSRRKIADDFTLPMPGQKTFRLSEHRGKVVMINFWATWCPPCREEMPAMERLYRQHKDDGFMMLAISLDADPKVVGPYLQEHKLTMPVAFDPDMAIADKYGVRALPSSFIVDREGNMTALAVGPRHWDNDAAHSLVEAMAR
jgi:peroxiredoxin